MIPKKIHYVWVGGKAKPKEIKKCLNSWKKYLKDYEIIEWNEKNFDINSHHFCKKAYQMKKWAFVSDYIRTKVLYEEGGIYLDTDVMLLDNFDGYLENRSFVGFENNKYICTACFGMEKNHPFMKRLINYYDNVQFEYNKQNEMDYVNTKIFSTILKDEYNLELNNEKQIIKDGILVLPDTVLCNPSKDSICIHIFTGTWMENKHSLKFKVVKILKLHITNKKIADIYFKLTNK